MPSGVALGLGCVALPWLVGLGLGWGSPLWPPQQDPLDDGSPRHPLILICPCVGFFAWAEAVLFQAYCGQTISWQPTLSKPREQLPLLLGPVGLIADHFAMTIPFTGCLPRERIWLVACWFVSQDTEQRREIFPPTPAQFEDFLTFWPIESCSGQALCTCLNILIENRVNFQCPARHGCVHFFDVKKVKTFFPRANVLSFTVSDGSFLALVLVKQDAISHHCSRHPPHFANQKNFSPNACPVTLMSHGYSCHFSRSLNTSFSVASASPCTKQ